MEKFLDCEIFLSSLRRNDYEIFERFDDSICLYRETDRNLARHVIIAGHNVIADFSNNFSQAILVINTHFPF